MGVDFILEYTTMHAPGETKITQVVQLAECPRLTVYLQPVQIGPDKVKTDAENISLLLPLV